MKSLPLGGSSSSADRVIRSQGIEVRHDEGPPSVEAFGSRSADQRARPCDEIGSLAEAARHSAKQKRRRIIERYAERGAFRSAAKQAAAARQQGHASATSPTSSNAAGVIEALQALGSAATELEASSTTLTVHGRHQTNGSGP